MNDLQFKCLIKIETVVHLDIKGRRLAKQYEVWVEELWINSGVPHCKHMKQLCLAVKT